MPEKLNKFSTVIIPSIFKVYLSTLLLLGIMGLIYLAINLTVGISLIAGIMFYFLLSAVLQEHIYHRIGSAIMTNGDIKCFSFKSDFIAKAIIIIMLQGFMMVTVVFITYQFINITQMNIANVILALVFESLVYITNSVLISFALQGSSIGEGFCNGFSFIVRHPILNISLALILTSLTIIPFAGYAFFFIGFVITEYIRTYKFALDIGDSSLEEGYEYAEDQY